MERIPHSYVHAFVHGGRANFTVQNSKTGNKLVLTVVRPYPDREYFRVYTKEAYLGRIEQEVFRTEQTTIIPNIQALQFKRFYKQVVAHNLLEELEVYHHGRCGRCGRKLTDPDSIVQGMGPECRKKLNLGTFNHS